MKKGDMRRVEILRSAEKMFFEKGYENTSIQDVLDDMKLSKGGFYHHFESKLQLLEAICAEKTDMAFERGMNKMRNAENNPIAQFNTLFQEGGLFGEANIKYFSLLLKNAYGENMCAIRDQMRGNYLANYTPVLRDILLQGMAQNIFFVAQPEQVSRLLVMLSCDLTDDIAFIMSKPAEERGDMSKIIDLIETYRKCIERILNAPYGSIEIVDLKRVVVILNALNTQGVRQEWRGEL